jgi:hypothetical protein
LTQLASFAASDDGTFDGGYSNDAGTPYLDSDAGGFAASGDGGFERGYRNDVGTRCFDSNTAGFAGSGDRSFGIGHSTTLARNTSVAPSATMPSLDQL